MTLFKEALSSQGDGVRAAKPLLQNKPTWKFPPDQALSPLPDLPEIRDQAGHLMEGPLDSKFSCEGFCCCLGVFFSLVCFPHQTKQHQAHCYAGRMNWLGNDPQLRRGFYSSNRHKDLICSPTQLASSRVPPCSLQRAQSYFTISTRLQGVYFMPKEAGTYIPLA